MTVNRQATLIRWLLFLCVGVLMVGTLTWHDTGQVSGGRNEKLYFPSGKFLVESSVGFRGMAADYLWFRFVQYYGAFAKGHNDLRYFDSIIDGIVRLDPSFVEAYHFASLVKWSDFGDFPGSIDMLKRGVLHNPDIAKLKFQIGFTYYVFYRDMPRAAFWFEQAAACSDATDFEQRFAAFARYRAGDDNVSLQLWKKLYASTENGQIRSLAEKMIGKLTRRLENRKIYGDNFIGPIPEI